MRKFILPAQNHGVHFTSDTDKPMCDEIRAILDGVLGAPQDIETITNNQSPITNKILRNGQIYILRGDKTYTIQGQEVK